MEFDVERIIKAMIDLANGQRAEFDEMETLQHRLREIIYGKKVLIVLDDVWNEEWTKWEFLMSPLKGIGEGSKIVVTTRNEKIVVATNTTYRHHLRTLSPDESWSMFSSRAFIGRMAQEQLELDDIGRKIVERCRGVPLAVKALGSALAFKRKEDWEPILESETWASETHILPTLLLSYYNLPSRLKWCFAFCSIFKKNLNIEKLKLIKMWMTQYFVSNDRYQDMECKAELHFDFDDLQGRFCFQESVKDSVDNVISWKMHDLGS